MSRIYLNDDWYFTEHFTDSLNDKECKAELKKVRLPHTCKETAFHYFDEHEYQMVSGYRKSLFVPKEWEDKSVVLTFEAIGHFSKVYVNGKEAASHACGYTAFSIELSDLLNYGEDNLIVVSCDSNENLNVPPFGFVIDYMTYGGIYREAYIEVRDKRHVKDVFVRSKIDGASKTLVSDIELSQEAFADKELFVRQSIVSKEDNAILAKYEKPVDSLETAKVTFKITANEVELWNLDNPILYDIVTELFVEETVVDKTVTSFGFRKAEFKEDGFYLNGKKTKIRGLNRHQSYPYVGYAMPESMQRLDADILKNELGCNAVRTSHYPQSHYFINQCDEIGLLVFTEIPGWQHIGDAAWKDQAVENVKDMVLEYRNHPSIILWGVRINESPDDDEFYKRTNAMCHSLDDSRQTGGVRCIKNSHLFEDVYTYNDFSHDGLAKGCEPKKNVTSDMKKGYLISEYNGHMYPTKTMDWEEHRVEHALRHARVLNEVNNQEDIAGSFGWCMFDYNTHKDFGSGDRICYHGVMDMFRNPKLASLIYSCEGAKEPVLELSSSMDIGEHPGCNRGYTYIISNADSVRMYKNDVFIKEYTKADSPFENLKHGPMLINDFIGNQIHEKEDFKQGQADAVKFLMNYTALHGYGKYPPKLIWNAAKCVVRYHMNPNEAVGLYNKYIGDWGGTSTVYRFEAIKDGKVVKTIVKEPMKTWKLVAEANTTSLTEKSSYDVAEIRLKVCDDNGNLLPFFQESVKVSIDGPLELIGPDIIALRGGMAGLYVKTIGQFGNAKVKFEVLNQAPVETCFEITGECN